MSAVGGKVLPKFRHIFPMKDKDPLRWFPGHMGKGLKQMQQTLINVDCVIEVHDARIPISGRYLDFKRTVTGIKPHIFVLNKIDLANIDYKRRIMGRLKEEGIQNIFFTNFRNDTCKETSKIVPLALDLIKNSNRYNRITAEDYSLMIIGAPNVGKSSLINRLRNKHLRKKNAALVGAAAGITRSLQNRIKISESPDVYLLDTPGILDPFVRDVYGGLKLAICGCIQDTIVGSEIMSDYLLFWMNKHERFEYVDVLNLLEPTDNVVLLLSSIAKKFGMTFPVKDIATGRMVTRYNISLAGSHFIRQFRKGDFGKYCLDQDILDTVYFK